MCSATAMATSLADLVISALMASMTVDLVALLQLELGGRAPAALAENLILLW